MQLIVPNLTFEDDLGDLRTKITPQTQRAFNELAPVLGLIADKDDIVLVPEVPQPEDIPESLQHVHYRQPASLRHDDIATDTSVVPWGWTAQLRALATERNCDLSKVPATVAVIEANSRRFNAEHDRLTPEPSPGSAFETGTFGRLCDSIDVWTQEVRRLRQFGFERWVTKAQLSHAGRNRLLGSGIELNDQQNGWLKKHFAQPGGVYLEPWVPVVDECGLQFEITQQQIRFVGVAQLMNDKVGRYSGSLIAADERLQQSWTAAIEHGYTVCRSALAAGYWGPLGIDAFRFVLPNGDIATRLCNDINGRFTMGRVALHLQKWLKPNEYGLWTHHVVPDDPRKFAAYLESLIKLKAEGVKTIATSPLKIAGNSVRQRTTLLIGQTPAQLLILAQNIQNR